MFKKIKMLAALLLLVCLCLPLSKCTVQGNPLVENQKERVYERYVAQIDLKEPSWSYLLVAPFVLPMLMVLFNIKAKHESLSNELFDVLLGLLVLAVLMLHKFTGELILGGYIALVAASAYLLSSLIESGITIKKQYLDNR